MLPNRFVQQRPSKRPFRLKPGCLSSQIKLNPKFRWTVKLVGKMGAKRDEDASKSGAHRCAFKTSFELAKGDVKAKKIEKA